MKIISTENAEEAKAVEVKLVSLGFTWAEGSLCLENWGLYKRIQFICYHEVEKRLTYYTYNTFKGEADITAEEFLRVNSGKKYGYFFTGNPNEQKGVIKIMKQLMSFKEMEGKTVKKVRELGELGRVSLDLEEFPYIGTMLIEFEEDCFVVIQKDYDGDMEVRDTSLGYAEMVSHGLVSDEEIEVYKKEQLEKARLREVSRLLKVKENSVKTFKNLLRENPEFKDLL